MCLEKSKIYIQNQSSFFSQSLKKLFRCLQIFPVKTNKQTKNPKSNQNQNKETKKPTKLNKEPTNKKNPQN